MKLLVIGSDEVWSLERFYVKYLREAGVQTGVMPAQSIFYKYYNKSILHKLLYRTGLSGIERTITNFVKEAVQNDKPDIVWVFKGMELTPDLLTWIKDRGALLVNYNPDNPFFFSGRGSGNRNVSRSIGLYDLHFTYDTDIRSRIEQEYKIPCAMLPFGFELNDELYARCLEQEEVMKVCFLGNPDEHRAAFLKQLAPDIPVDVYGHGWEQYPIPGVTVCAPVYGDDFWKTMYRYRVQLNLMRPHNPASHNMRSFEVPGVGGIGLFPDTIDHRRFFDDGINVFLFANAAACKQKAASLLNMTAGDAVKIRALARQKSLEAGYTYRDRALQALMAMKHYTA